VKEYTVLCAQWNQHAGLCNLRCYSSAKPSFLCVVEIVLSVGLGHESLAVARECPRLIFNLVALLQLSCWQK
jgi:hypothetical protein